MSSTRHTGVDPASMAIREGRALIDAAQGLRRAARPLPAQSSIAADLRMWAEAMTRAAEARRVPPSAALSAERPRGCRGAEERERRRHSPTE